MCTDRNECVASPPNCDQTCTIGDGVAVMEGVTEIDSEADTDALSLTLADNDAEALMVDVGDGLALANAYSLKSPDPMNNVPSAAIAPEDFTVPPVRTFMSTAPVLPFTLTMLVSTLPKYTTPSPSTTGLDTMRSPPPYVHTWLPVERDSANNNPELEPMYKTPRSPSAGELTIASA